MSASRPTTVDVEGRHLRLSNLDKVLYPKAHVTKAEVIDYYSRVAPALLPHLQGRPLTVKRYPDGVDGEFFFEKNAPQHTPSWVRKARLPSPGSSKERETIDYIVVDDLATLVWLANLAALELHVPQWRVGPGGKARKPDLVVYDLDPGPGANVVDCAEVACWIRDRLAKDGLRCWAKTSGSKGLQLYVPVTVRSEAATSTYARAVADELASAHPNRVVASMRKELRKGKVFIDWSQNNTAKTTVAPYSLRARPRPTVSTPLTWEEVEGASEQTALTFEFDDVLERVGRLGDLLADMGDSEQVLPRG
jgi:bifunctional non-homologous end joining protein LigD